MVILKRNLTAIFFGGGEGGAPGHVFSLLKMPDKPVQVADFFRVLSN
jgi:hypothetical protein